MSTATADLPSAITGVGEFHSHVLQFVGEPFLFLRRSYGDELVLQVGSWRRTIVLPRALVDTPTTGAKMEGGILQIAFSTKTEAATKEVHHD